MRLAILVWLSAFNMSIGAHAQEAQALFESAGYPANPLADVSDADLDSFEALIEEAEIAADPYGSGGGTVSLGLEAEPFQFLSVIRLGPNGLCTGTIIHPQAVLTAAHCAVNDSGRIWSRFTIALRTTEGDNRRLTLRVKTVPGKNFFIHPKAFTKITDATPCSDGTPTQSGLCFSRRYDLAVILLEEPVPDAKTRVTPIATSAEIGGAVRVTFTGYGHHYMDLETGEISETLGRLHYVNSQKVPMKMVKGSFAADSFVMESEVNLQGADYSVVVCNGDSGGPLFVADPSTPTAQHVAGVNHAVLYGGSAEACAVPNNRSYFVGVVGPRDYIDDILKRQFGN